jgi:uncharacterized protein YndB with AHSA1/START domain
MTSKYERTFSVSVPVERAWRAFTDPADLEQWFTTSFDEGDDGRSTAASPGGPVGFEVVEADPRARLRYRQWGATPERGIDVTIVFESDESGTKITMTQSGFGGETIFESDEVHNGMDETLADLVLYLDYGIAVPRHRDMATNASLGAVLRAHAAGPPGGGRQRRRVRGRLGSAAGRPARTTRTRTRCSGSPTSRASSASTRSVTTSKSGSFATAPCTGHTRRSARAT